MDEINANNRQSLDSHPDQMQNEPQNPDAVRKR